MNNHLKAVFAATALCLGVLGTACNNQHTDHDDMNTADTMTTMPAAGPADADTMTPATPPAVVDTSEHARDTLPSR